MFTLNCSDLFVYDFWSRELGGLIHKKTRGNCFFVIEFIRSILKNNMLSFSAESYRWIWDCDVLDMQMISDEVAEFLATAFRQFPLALMQTLKIVSCLGIQFEDSTIVALNSGNGVLSFNMQDQLHLAVQEGILVRYCHNWSKWLSTPCTYHRRSFIALP